MNLKFQFLDNINDYLEILKEKLSDLPKTNYQLGMNHLSNGRVWEALSRFRIIRFFWPDHREASYQYAYCLILEGKIENAKKALSKLMEKYPNYKQASDLFIKVQKQNFEQIQKEYKETYLKTK